MNNWKSISPWNIIISVVYVLLCILTSGYSWTSGEIVSNLFVGNIEVSGVVVDANGDAVDFVTMSVEVASDVGDPFSGFPVALEYSQLLTNGLFHLVYTNTHGVQFELTHSNYLSSSWYYYVEGTTLITNGVVRSVVMTNENIRLLPKPGTYEMLHYDLQVWASTTGEVLVVDVAEGSNSVYQTSAGTDDFPSTVFYMVASTNSDGAYAVDSFGLPSNAVLRVNGDGGMVSYQVPAALSNEVASYSPFLHMQTAPVDGYTNALTISSGQDYFFFNVTNLFGKGVLSTPHLVSSNKFECHLILYVATNGLRNVATEE